MNTEFQRYRRSGIAEMRPYQPGDDLEHVSISNTDKASNGSPKEGDMIARNPGDHTDVWLVSKKYFEANFEPVPIEKP